MDPDVPEIEFMPELLLTGCDCIVLCTHIQQEKPYEPDHMVAHGIKGQRETQLLGDSITSLLQKGKNTPQSPQLLLQCNCRVNASMVRYAIPHLGHKGETADDQVAQ